MGEQYFSVQGPLGDTLTIEKTGDGQYELVTEFDRRIVSEAYVNSLWRDAGFDKSVWTVPGGLPSLGKKRH